MAIFPLAPDQTIAQMWSNGVRGGIKLNSCMILRFPQLHPYQQLIMYVYSLLGQWSMVTHKNSSAVVI